MAAHAVRLCNLDPLQGAAAWVKFGPEDLKAFL